MNERDDAKLCQPIYAFADGGLVGRNAQPLAAMGSLVFPIPNKDRFDHSDPFYGLAVCDLYRLLFERFPLPLGTPINAAAVETVVSPLKIEYPLPVTGLRQRHHNVRPADRASSHGKLRQNRRCPHH